MPCSKNIGTNTMQMHSSETNAGPTICAAPSRIAVFTVLPCSRCQLMFSMVTVASSTRIPTANASPPNVITLRVCPLTASNAMAESTARGIDAAMIKVERQLPRNSRIIALVSNAAMMPSWATLPTDCLTNTEASPSSEVFNDGGRVSLMRGSIWRIPSMIDSVEMLPFFSAGISTARWPSTRTILVCGGEPSRTWATWPMVISAPSTVLIGRSLSSSMALGLLLSRIVYSLGPSLAVPTGMIWFCSARALPTSWADKPLAASA